MSFLSRKEIGFTSFLIITTGIIHCLYLCYAGSFVIRGWNTNFIIVTLMGLFGICGNFAVGFVFHREALYGLYYHLPGRLDNWLWLYGSLISLLSGYIYTTDWKLYEIQRNSFLLLNSFGIVTEFLVAITKHRLEAVWRNLIKEHLLNSQVVKYAVICTADTGNIMMTTDNFGVTEDQLRDLIMHYTDVATMTQG